MIAALAVALGAVAQAVTGLGFSLVSAPVLIAALGHTEGVRLNLLLSASLNAVLLVGERHQTQWRSAGLLLVPAVAVTPLLAIAFRRVDADVLTVAAGVLTLLSAAALARGLRLHRARGRRGAVVAGVASASMNLVGGIGGPAIALYAVNADWPAGTFRPTMQAYAFVLNSVGLAAIGLPKWSPSGWAGLAVGWLVGLVVARRVPDRLARPAILGVAAAGGLAAIVHTLL